MTYSSLKLNFKVDLIQLLELKLHLIYFIFVLDKNFFALVRMPIYTYVHSCPLTLVNHSFWYLTGILYYKYKQIRNSDRNKPVPSSIGTDFLNSVEV